MNHQSSIGLTEEMITNLLNAVAFEYHQKINCDKYHSILHIKGVDSEEERLMYEDLLSNTMTLLKQATDIRRNTMRILQYLSVSDNKDLWCSLKHVAVMVITSFEAWQVDLNNSELEEHYHSTVELFNNVISSFLGFAPVPCSACFADMLQNKEQMDEIKAKAIAKLEKNNESVSKGNTSKS